MSVNLVVALDVPHAEDAFRLAGKLKGCIPWMKVGLELFTAEGPLVVSRLKDMGFNVFLDLKFHDIPNTVKGAARSAGLLGADLVTLHHAGGERMAKAALEGIAESGHRVMPFAVTMLTSTSTREAGFAATGEMTMDVSARAVQIKEWGLPGVVCSGHEAASVKAVCGPNFLCLCPGIRMPDAAADDQRRVMTPAEAVKAGADFLVVGRPITRAENPLDAARRILEDMET
jgi:orotidine 5''-phosphate decarboxylase, subfamily 1